MTRKESYERIVARMEVQRVRASVGRRRGDANAEPLPRLGPWNKIGVWIWVVLLGASTAYELLAFTDGVGGNPTLSQLVKAMKRSGGIAGATLVTTGLFGGAVVLFLHWVLEWF